MTPARFFLSITAALLLTASVAIAQQPAPEGRNPSSDAPSFTNDDLPVPEPSRRTSDASKASQSGELTDEEIADAAQATETGDGAPAGAGKKGPSKAELDWRRRYSEAQNRAAAATKAAQEAEIQLTELRNQLGVGGGERRGDTLSAIERQGQIINDTRDRMTATRAALEAVRAEGARRGFSPGAGPSRTTKDGKPNKEFYRERYVKAQGALADAERRIALFQNRVSDLSTRITINSGGDQFTQLRLQADLREANEGLEKARADREAARTRLDEAGRDAEAAGFFVENR
jgi:hypothetical protein